MCSTGCRRRAEVPGALYGDPAARADTGAERPVGAVAAPDRAPARVDPDADPSESAGQPVLPRGTGPLPDRFPPGVSGRRAVAGPPRRRNNRGAGERPEPHLE